VGKGKYDRQQLTSNWSHIKPAILPLLRVPSRPPPPLPHATTSQSNDTRHSHTHLPFSSASPRPAPREGGAHRRSVSFSSFPRKIKFLGQKRALAYQDTERPQSAHAGDFTFLSFRVKKKKEKLPREQTSLSRLVAPKRHGQEPAGRRTKGRNEKLVRPVPRRYPAGPGPIFTFFYQLFHF